MCTALQRAACQCQHSLPLRPLKHMAPLCRRQCEVALECIASTAVGQVVMLRAARWLQCSANAGYAASKQQVGEPTGATTGRWRTSVRVMRDVSQGSPSARTSMRSSLCPPMPPPASSARSVEPPQPEGRSEGSEREPSTDTPKPPAHSTGNPETVLELPCTLDNACTAARVCPDARRVARYMTMGDLARHVLSAATSTGRLCNGEKSCAMRAWHAAHGATREWQHRNGGLAGERLGWREGVGGAGGGGDRGLQRQELRWRGRCVGGVWPAPAKRGVQQRAALSHAGRGAVRGACLRE